MKKKIIGIIVFLFVSSFLIGLIVLVQIKEDENMKYKNYTDLSIVSSIIPYSTHLWWETDSAGTLYVVDSLNQDTLYKSTDKCETFDTDNGVFSSGSYQRTRKIQGGYHDRTNQKIYFVSCNQADTQFTCWYLDLTDDTVTEMGTYAGDDVYAFDIIENTDFFVVGREEIAAVDTMAMYKWVDPNWVQRATEDNIVDVTNMIIGSFVGGDYPTIAVEDNTGDTYIYNYIDATPAFGVMPSSQIVGGTLPPLNQRGIAYYNGTGNADFIYIIDVVGGTNYLYMYDVANTTITQSGEYDIALMLDRNTASGVQEKAFHLTSYYVYQIQTNTKKLHLIASLDTTNAIKAITDNFVIVVGGGMWEYIDATNSVVSCSIRRGDMQIPTAKFDLLDTFPIVKGMFVIIEDFYSANDSNYIYFGTYNFKDDADGVYTVDADAEAGITFVDTANIGAGSSISIIASLEGHRKVLKLTRVTNNVEIFKNISASGETTGTYEFWFYTLDSTKRVDIVTYEDASTEECVQLMINGGKLQYYSGGIIDVTDGAIANSTLYLIRVTFDCVAHTFDIYINGVLKDAGLAFRDARDLLKNIKILVSEDVTCYFDAVGYSWDTDYKIGDNKIVEEGEPNHIIFEGYVDSFTNKRKQVATLVSPAIELINIYPSGNYSGRSDEIIVSLISDYCKYVTSGTMSAGGAMGTITFSGDKTLFQLLIDLALFDKFIWYLTPTGKLYYNNGTVDSLIDLISTSRIFNVLPMTIKRAINYVLIRGAYVDGVQVSSDGSHSNQADIDQQGINPFERTHSHLNTAALCNTCASNILTRLGTQALALEYDYHDARKGLIQEGETKTITYTGIDFSISETQYGIRQIIYDAFRGRSHYRMSDRIA